MSSSICFSGGVHLIPCHVARGATAKLLKAIVSPVGMIALDRDVLLDAFRRYTPKNVDFADALLPAQAAPMNISLASFDRNLHRFEDVKRYESQNG